MSTKSHAAPQKHGSAIQLPAFFCNRSVSLAFKKRCRCRHEYCCASDLNGGHIGKIMNNLRPFSSSKECDLRRSAMLQGGGRSSSRALDRISVASTVRHGADMTNSSDTPFAGSAYDRLDYDSLDEDTIEIVLSPEDMQLLSRAADEALAEAKATREMAATLVASLGPSEANATQPWPPTSMTAAAKPTVTAAAANSAGAAARPTAKPAGSPKASVASKPAGAATLPTVKPSALTAASVVPNPTSGAAAPTARPTAAIATPATATASATAVPTATQPTNATAAPMARPSTLGAAPAAAKIQIPAGTPQTNKPSAATSVPAAPQPTPAAATVIPVLSAANPSTVAAPPPPTSTKTPAMAKGRVLPANRPTKTGGALRQITARLPLGMMGIVGIAAATAVAIASIAHHSRHDVASVSASTVAPSAPAIAPAPTNPTPETAAAPDPAATDAAQPQPVHVKNPFDHSEVFEFPPGTSLKDARQSVAQILMQRAHDRGVPTFHPGRSDRHPVARSKPSKPSNPIGLAQNSR